MKIKKKAILFLFVILIQKLISQNVLQFEGNVGTAFQKEMILNDEYLDNCTALGIRFGINYLFAFKNKFNLEAGFYGKFTRIENEVSTTKFVSNSFRLQIPFYVGYKIAKKWKLNIGSSIENNRNFNNIDLRRQDNFRYDFLTKAVYEYRPKIHFSLYTNWMLHNVSDTFTLSNPRNGVYIGVIYQIKNKTNG